MSEIRAYSDFFVKYLLGSNENKDLLLSFINSVMIDSGFEPMMEVTINNPFNLKTFRFDKESILDIKAIDDKGRIFNIEIQTYGKDVFPQRSLYYWAKNYSTQLTEGDHYTKLHPVICINVVSFKMNDEIDRYHTCFVPAEKEAPEYVLTDHFIIHYLELPKMSRMINQEHFDSKLEKWMLFFKEEGQREELVKILIKDDPEINKAHKIFKGFNEDEQIRDMYEAHLKWKRDFNYMKDHMLQEGLEQGIEQGIEQGMEKAKLNIIQNLKENGLSNEKIQQYTQISIDEIERLLNQKEH